MRKIIIIFFAGLMFISSVYSQEKIYLKDIPLTVELARTPQEHMRGLMGRKSLKPDQGMLFLFDEEGIYPFWMKDTLIPLDIIWLDKEKRVVHIAENVQPCGESECEPVDPGVPALYVLEVNAGFAARSGLTLGDTLKTDGK